MIVKYGSGENDSYSLDEKLVKMLNLMCERCSGRHRFDNVVLIDGDEGYGKSNLSMGCAYYMSQKTGRKFDVDHVFFDPEELMKFASETQDQIIVFDEAALIALASDWQNKGQKKLVQFLMVARKKRHIYFINIPKFFRLNEYFVVDRSIALIHVYARKEINLGRFAYFKKESKNNLYYEIKRTKKRSYRNYYNFHGSFPIVIGKVIDEEIYDQKKDKAIMNLSQGKESVKGVSNRLIIRLKYNLAKLYKEDKHFRDNYFKHLGIGLTTIRDWIKLKDKYPDVVEPEIFV